MKVHEILGDYDQLDSVLVTVDGETFELLEEGKVISGRFDRNIRIDQPTHLQGEGEPHAHVYGRKGEQLGVVNLSGTSSHGTKFKLHPKDADALRDRGFYIPPDNLVEWLELNDAPELLFG